MENIDLKLFNATHNFSLKNKASKDRKLVGAVAHTFCLYVLIILIMPPPHSLPACYLSVEASKMSFWPHEELIYL